MGSRLSRWIELKRQQVAAGDLSPTYLRELDRYARPNGCFQFVSPLSIHEISYGCLEDWVQWLAARGLSGKTRRNVLGAFRSFMSWLHRRGEIDRIPEFPEIPVDEYTPVIISSETQDLVLQAIPEGRRGGFLAAAHLGLRPGEIRALDVSDYHDGWITISKAVKGPSTKAPIRGTKTRKVRRLPVDEELRAWIERRMAEVTAEERLRGPVPLFPNPTGRSVDRRWTSNALREEWNRACDEVGVRVRMYEGTKHAFASDALRRNVPKEKLQKFLGHADARSTDRYAKLADGALVDVLRPPDLSLACRSPKNEPKKRSSDAQFWRGGRDSNPEEEDET